MSLKYKKNNIVIKLANYTTRLYINPKAFASIIGALGETNYSDITINGFTTSDGTGAPSVTHINGIAEDLRYLRKGKKIVSLEIDKTLMI